MTTESSDGDKATSPFKTIWPYIYYVIQIITLYGAAAQVGFCAIFLLLIIIGAICAAHNMHAVTGFLDSFTGLGVGAQISREFDIKLFLIVLVFVLIASCPLYLCVKLCQGLEKNKEEYIIMYIICGVILLGVRVWNIDSYEYNHFPEDKTILYCALYGLYLLLLVITCFEIRRARREELKLLNEMKTLSMTAHAFLATLEEQV